MQKSPEDLDLTNETMESKQTNMLIWEVDDLGSMLGNNCLKMLI